MLSEAEELDHGAREEAENGLLELFLDSSEGRALPDVAPCSVFLDLAGFHLGVTLATLDPRGPSRDALRARPQQAFVRAGRAAGFDMDEERGVGDWAETIERLLSEPAAVSDSSGRTRDHTALREKKKRRKAAERARRRNRQR